MELARRGANLVVNDSGVSRGGADPDPGPAASVVSEICRAGGRAVASCDDVADFNSATAIVDAAVKAFGGVDILVTNAGINRLAPFHETTAEDFAAIVSVHLFGTFHVARAAYDVMRRAGHGRIVMTTSQIAWEGKADLPAYGAAKGGILGLLATLALTAPNDGIRVNAVAPFALTRAAEGVFPEKLRPWLDPAQVSAMVAFLASDDCLLNGEVLIGGGCHFAAAETRESAGFDFGDPGEITAEAIAARIADIADMTGAIRYRDALEAVGATFARLEELEGRE